MVGRGPERLKGVVNTGVLRERPQSLRDCPGKAWIRQSDSCRGGRRGTDVLVQQRSQAQIARRHLVQVLQARLQSLPFVAYVSGIDEHTEWQLTLNVESPGLHVGLLIAIVIVIVRDAAYIQTWKLIRQGQRVLRKSVR